MTASEVSDLLAQLVYPGTFIVCVTWVGIAIAHMTNGHKVRYAMLALSMGSAALAFGMLAFNAGRQLIPMYDVLIYFRVLVTLATVFGATFTAMYLYGIWLRSTRGRHADDQGMD